MSAVRPESAEPVVPVLPEPRSPHDAPPTPTCLTKYRHFKPKDLAVVRIEGRDVYLGKYDSPESHERYRRGLAGWLSGIPGGALHAASKPDADLTVNEVILAYIQHADAYYLKGGKPTGESESIDMPSARSVGYLGCRRRATSAPLP